MFKKEIIIFIIITLIIISAEILIRPLCNLDELWQYNIPKNIANGLLPYKDISFVSMPFLPMICAIFFWFLGNQLIIMRILAIIISLAIMIMTLKILTFLNLNKILKYTFLIIIYLLYIPYFAIDYNFLTLLITLIIIYIELKSINGKGGFLKYSLSCDLTIGILIGIAITTKQTTGIILAIATIGYKTLLIRKKEDIREVLKTTLMKILGILIPVMIMLIYMAIFGIWESFLEYSIYGIKTFSNKVAYTRLFKLDNRVNVILSMMLPIEIIIMFIICIIDKIKMESKINIFIIFSYSIAQFSIVFPISDEPHFLIAVLPGLIGTIYLIDVLIKYIANKSNIHIYSFAIKIIETCMAMLILLLIGLSSYKYYLYFKDININTLNNYKYIPINEEKISHITNINNYILQQNEEGRQVYILDATAAMYMIPIDKYNKDYDMFLIGNLGSKGENGQIEKIKKQKNDLFLIMNDENSRNWQNPEEVRKYIKKNMRKIDEIECFDIYENKNIRSKK